MANKPLKTLNFGGEDTYDLAPDWENIENKPESPLKVLEGTRVVNVSEDVTTGEFTISYPQGFIKDNCVVLSVNGKNLGYNNLGDYSEFCVAGAEVFTQLTSSGVKITFMYEPGNHNVSYRVTLYKYK